MTLMSYLLLIILFLVFFIYFSGLNPQDITVYYLPDESFTYSVAIVVVGCILLGLVLGYAAHVYGVMAHLFKHWRRERVEKKAQEISSIYREGVGRLLSGDVKKAHSLLQKALDRDPSRVDTYIAMANVHLQEDNPEEAVNLLLKARELAPRSLEALFKLATTYEETNRDEEAVDMYGAILSIEKGNRKALRCLRELHVKHGRWAEALELQKQVLKVGPGSNRLEEEKNKLLSLRYEVARQTLESGDIDPAKDAFKGLIKEAPSFIPARVSLGDAYRQQDRFDDAVKVWQDAYLETGKSVFLSRLEELYLEAEDPASLLGVYRDFMEKRDNDLVLRLFFGKLCLRLEMVDEALEQLFAVESTGVETPQLHLLLAEAHRRRNRVDDSVEQYKKALGIDGRLRLNYVCDDCHAVAEDWHSRCAECGTWGSFSVAGRQQILNAPPPVEARAIHHGERE